MKSYSELIKLPSFNERLEYLKLYDNNALSPRDVSMNFYKSNIWMVTRNEIITRDLGFDLGVIDMYIYGQTIVHHINPITEYDIIDFTRKLLDPENLITTSIETHNIIHYDKKVKDIWVERTPGDTILW